MKLKDTFVLNMDYGHMCPVYTVTFLHCISVITSLAMRAL
jgi:hypothetical protein